ncbi:hypothetical protein CU098_004686 [Rhizopus stolonifer]|uniref:L-ascorbate oxidase n=1 Tax=Rhizopus stolonifer TaxID=4846 RepID=A0A367KC43_RHIST|nr:hypothetical protein CU098_004686 [Rhizopus stolonifer]
MLRLLSVVYLLLLFEITVAQTLYDETNQNIRFYEFNITQKSINPDCSNQTTPAFLINEQMPGPVVSATQGDIVRVLVRNQLEHGPNEVSIHFHGIRQYGSVHSDGVPYLTQKPIAPGETFLHEFRVINQAGTFFYHAHVGMQESTLFGPIIIYESEDADPENYMKKKRLSRLTFPKSSDDEDSDEDEDEDEEEDYRMSAGPYEYDEERTLILSEWWHRTHTELEEYLLGPNFKGIPEAETILINGMGLRDPNNIEESECRGYDVVPVKPNKTYRLRVIGATAFRTLGLAIANHNLTIIEVDGELTQPHTVNELEVASGQRFSVLLKTHHDIDDFGIQVVRRWSDDIQRATNGLAVLRYEPEVHQESNDRGVLHLKNPFVRVAPHHVPSFDGPDKELPNWLWPNIQPLHGVDPIVYKSPSRTIVLRATDKKQSDGRSRWYINEVSYSEEMSHEMPILEQLRLDRRPLPAIDNLKASSNGYDRNLGTYPIRHFEIVDFVFQSTHIPGEPCRSHPWHTHGHSHWEIANGMGEYSQKKHGHIRNVKTPIQKDITMVYPFIDPQLSIPQNNRRAVGCGWSKDNPGIWAIHCHNTAHMLMGMMTAIEEAPELISRTSRSR